MAIVDVVNIALRDVGEQALTAIDDTTPRGKIVGDIYQEIRDKEFRSHAWNFAMRRGGLGGFNVPAPDHEFERAFLLPTGSGNYNKWMRLVDVDRGRSRYRLEKGTVLSNQAGTLTNALSDQADFTSSNWTETGTGSVTANSVTGPDFALNADTIDDTDAAAAYNVSQGVTAQGDLHHFFGVKVKANTASYATIQMKFTGGQHNNNRICRA